MQNGRTFWYPTSATRTDRKSTRLNSSHANIYTLSLHDALPIFSEVLDRIIHLHANIVENLYDICAGKIQMQANRGKWLTKHVDVETRLLAMKIQGCKTVGHFGILLPQQEQIGRAHV